MQACVLSSLRVEWVSSTWGTKKLIWYLASLLHQKPWKSVTGWGEGRLNLLERHYCFYKKCFRYNCFEDNIIWWQWLFISEYFILRLVTYPTTGKGAYLGIFHNNIVIISGGPLSALTCCVNARLLSAIKKISPLIYSQSWVESWVYTTQAMMTFTLIF